MSENKFSCREKKEAGKSCVCRMRQDPGNVGERERAVIMFTDYRSSPLTNGSGHGGTGVRGGWVTHDASTIQFTDVQNECCSGLRMFQKKHRNNTGIYK